MISMLMAKQILVCTLNIHTSKLLIVLKIRTYFLSLDESLMPWDIENEEQIISEKTGLLYSPNDNSRTLDDLQNTGLIWEPRKNTFEEEAYLTEMYNNMDDRALPTSYDSRSLGIITPIRHQRKRDTCVSFATVVALETGLKKAVPGTKLSKLDISEQQLLDCGYVDGSSGGGMYVKCTRSQIISFI